MASQQPVGNNHSTSEKSDTEGDRGDRNVMRPSNGNSNDDRDAMGNTKYVKTELRAPMPVARNATHYNMNHKHRGVAAIFNHEHFAVDKMRQRCGTAVDCDTLKKQFLALGFEVLVYNDLTFEQLSQSIHSLSRRNHSDSDCFVMCVLSHGEQNLLYSYDMAYKSEKIWSAFTPEHCPTLAGKPKLFFIQACQGEQLDGGVTLSSCETDGYPQQNLSYRIPSQADFLIAYSTVPNYYSWRNTTRGSWFIQAFCEELQLRGQDIDLLTLLTFTSQRVALDYESNTPDTPSMHAQKQIPCITSMLIRLVQFTPKSNGSCRQKQERPRSASVTDLDVRAPPAQLTGVVGGAPSQAHRRFSLNSIFGSLGRSNEVNHLV